MTDRELLDAIQRARAMELAAVKKLRAGSVSAGEYWALVARARQMELTAIEQWLLRNGRLAA